MKVAVLLAATVAIVGSLVHVGAVCTGGIAGVESTSLDVCCVEDCGTCGGVGCTPSVNSTLTASDCCGTEIVASGVFCDVSGVAPCILTTASNDTNSTCSNGLAGIEDEVNGACCDAACGLCGGEGCGIIAGLSGDDCCSSTILSNGTLCSVAGEAPCIIEYELTVSNSTCSNGLSGIEDSVEAACCDPACGQCGGAGCGNIAGLTGDDCCSSTIASNGTLCSVSGEAPCIIEYELTASNSTCSNGLSGIEDSVEAACCDPACGQCGGAGCGNIAGLTGDDCCSSTIASNGTLCSVSGEAPCIIEYELTASNSTCSNGLSGIEDSVEAACCDPACGQCGGAGCGNIAGLTGDDCCSSTIASNGTLCSVSGEAPCIIEYELTASNSTCSNGLSGIEDSVEAACCDPACGQCGGAGCGNIAGLTGDDCCSSTIASNGTLCSVSGEAPCIIEYELTASNSTCSNGFSGIEDTVEAACCDPACGQCGGAGCGNIPGLTGDDCCSSTIASNGTLCSVSGEAPCIIEYELTATNDTCSNGFAGIEDDPLIGACCDPACGQCGGAGCGTIPGLTSDDCCSSTISSNGTLCSIAGEAPCIIDPPEVISSTCPNGLAGVQDDSVCCAEACNLICGGEGCGTVYGTSGPSDCCSDTILEAGVYCEDDIVAPCIMVNGTYTPAPSVVLTTSSPTVTPRQLMFTSKPTMEGETMAPTFTPTMAPLPPTGISTAAPTPTPSEFETPAPSPVTRNVNLPTSDVDSFLPTSSPTSAVTDASGAATVSTGNLVTLVALVAGTFAVFAAARN